jgi:hypothetical protein
MGVWFRFNSEEAGWRLVSDGSIWGHRAGGFFILFFGKEFQFKTLADAAVDIVFLHALSVFVWPSLLSYEERDHENPRPPFFHNLLRVSTQMGTAIL